MRFFPFLFDSNNLFRVVDSPSVWRDLVQAEDHTIGQLLEARIAPRSEIQKLPADYFMGSMGVLTGAMPSFGFRREHTGEVTLGEWASAQGVNLRFVAFVDPRTWGPQYRVHRSKNPSRVIYQMLGLR